jgi:D-alanyl-D-alanine carboxypeptidase (penicillin-binding protein 5/6)
MSCRPRTVVAVLATALAAALCGPPAAASAAEPTPAPVAGSRLTSTGVVVSAAAGAGRLPAVRARSFVVADAGTGDVLAAKNAHGRMPPASTLKVLTALALLPRLKPDTEYTAGFDDANVEGSKVGIVPDATYTVHNLWEGLFLISGNDAAHALATLAGGTATTVGLMNRTARELGATDTTVVNPSGLDAPGQVSSAYDLAVFARAGLQREDFRAYAATVNSVFPGKAAAAGKGRKTFEIWSQNKLLLNYPGAVGVKTGYTTKAKGTFVGAATRGGRTLLVTLMHTDGRAWKEAAALLDWGFANAALGAPVGTLQQAPPPGTHAAAAVAPPRALSGSATTGAAGGTGLPWFGWLLLGLAGTVVLLRTRVLLRRRARLRRRAYALPPLAP